MVFSGLASGASAKILLDTGASHCFIDQSFAEQNGLALHPTRTKVQLADGSEASSLLKCHVKVHLSRHISEVSCYVLDMQQQYDLILGEDWLNKHRANLDYGSKTCSVFKNSTKFSLRPLKDQTHSSLNNTKVLLLNAAQVVKLQRQGCAKSFMVKVFDSNIDLSSHADKSSTYSPRVQQILTEFKDLSAPRETLPPVRDIAHTIPLEPGQKPPFRPIYRLSPIELH